MTSITSLWNIRPIGKVISSIKEPTSNEIFYNLRSTIEIYPEFEEGLQGLQGKSEILVIFLFHLNMDNAHLLVHPRGDISTPLRGVFATCSPARPNGLGTSRCRLIALDGPRIHLLGLEAIDGTPVIDVKPFSCLEPRYDLI